MEHAQGSSRTWTAHLFSGGTRGAFRERQFRVDDTAVDNETGLTMADALKHNDTLRSSA